MLTFSRRPPDSPTPDEQQADDLAYLAHRRLIGYLGVALPPLLILVSWIRPTELDERWRTLRSISDYYYTGASGVFVGLLVALGLVLLTYPGYGNANRRWDRRIAVAGGCAALCVAFFPTTAPAIDLRPPWWASWVGWTHYLSAGVLFASFAVFSLWLFRLKGSEPPTEAKLLRNRIYLACGLFIVVSMLVMAVCLLVDWPIFWPESVALLAFAASWVIKGGRFRALADGRPDLVRGEMQRSGGGPSGT